MVELTAERYSQELSDQTARLAALVHDADLTARVPTCPGWDLAKLVEHVGQAQRWAAAIVENGVSDPSRLPKLTEKLPMDRAGRQSWLVDGAARLSAAMRYVDPDLPVWCPTDTGGGAGFWVRRMLHEATVHRADAAAAMGETYDLEVVLAADAISEWLDLVTAQAWAARRPETVTALAVEGQTLHLHATDEPSLGGVGEWFIVREPDAVSWKHGHAEADLALRGPATQLLLVLLGRLPVAEALADRVLASGDIGIIEHWVEHMTF